MEQGGCSQGITWRKVVWEGSHAAGGHMQEVTWLGGKGAGAWVGLACNPKMHGEGVDLEAQLARARKARCKYNKMTER